MGSAQSNIYEYKSSYSIDIRLNNDHQNITYTILSPNRSSDRSIIKTITTVVTNRTVTYKVDPTTRQMTDNNGDLSGTDGDFNDFLSTVREISLSLADAWGEEKVSDVEKVSDEEKEKEE